METLIATGNVHKLVQLIRLLPEHPVIAIDTETTGLHPYGGDRIRGISIAFEEPRADLPEHGEIVSFYVPVGYPDPDQNVYAKGLELLFQALQEKHPFYVLHHGKFDFAFLRQLPAAPHGGPWFPFPQPDEWWDTKVGAWLIDENLPNGLKPLGVYYFGDGEDDEQKVIKALIKERGGWDKLTPEDTAQYAAKDAELTLRLYYLQRRLTMGTDPTVVGPDIDKAMERELAVQAVLFRMERTGILVDEGRVEELREAAAVEAGRIYTHFHDFYIWTNSKGKIEPFNIRSVKQVAWLLWDVLELETQYGRSVNRQALEQHEHHATVAPLLRFRRLDKALSGYLEPLLKLVGLDDRVHPTFWSTGTVTGRFSCSDPNLQTIPRADTLEGVREVFVADVGFELWEFDLQAAELRVMAGMAGEDRLIEQLENGVDMHSENAKELFGPNFTPLQRRCAKNIMYGWAYGLSSLDTAAKYITGCSREEAKKTAKRVLDGLKKLYPNIYRLMQTTSRQALKQGYMPVGESWPGRHRRYQTHAQRRPAGYTALNSRVQGGIGEFMKDVMLIAEGELERIGARLCLQVHDSLVIEVPDGCGPKVQEILQTIADDVNPFEMRMIFDGKPWEEHD